MAVWLDVSRNRQYSTEQGCQEVRKVNEVCEQMFRKARSILVDESRFLYPMFDAMPSRRRIRCHL